MLNFHRYPEIKFPENFLWGSATAAHQIEGDDRHSINWRDETEHPDRYPQHSGKACNSYALYREDVELVKSLGHQVYRFSIPWSRIEPEEGHFCQEAVDHYIDLLERLRKAGIKPFVTLSHGSDPAWFWDRGGFGSRDALPCFDRYVEFLVPKLDPLVECWMTINEINIMERPGVNQYELRRNYLIAHAHAFQIIRSHSRKPVGAPHAMQVIQPRDPHFEGDAVLASMTDWTSNGFFYHALRTGEIVLPGLDAETFPELKNSFDFWAINYYTRTFVSSRTKNGRGKAYVHERLKLVDRPFYIGHFYPEGLYTGLSRLKDKPLVVTENGTCCSDDRWRIAKLAQDLCAIREAMTDGVDIRGYLHWSLMDNYEWVSFIPRFGLVHVDYDTFRRTPKPSAAFYREIIENNGFGPPLLEKYLPELPRFELFE